MPYTIRWCAVHDASQTDCLWDRRKTRCRFTDRLMPRPDEPGSTTLKPYPQDAEGRDIIPDETQF